MDKRISTLREILFGIRVVKCYALGRCHAKADLWDEEGGGADSGPAGDVCSEPDLGSDFLVLYRA